MESTNSQIESLNNSSLKVKNFATGLTEGEWSGGRADFTFNVNMSNVVGVIPVVEYSGYLDLTCKLNDAISSSLTTMNVWVWARDSTTVPTYGRIRLYVFYTG